MNLLSYAQTALKDMATSCAKKILDANDGVEFFEQPFKHLVIDNFFTEEFADVCLSNFPKLDHASWEHANDMDIEVKYRTTWQSEFDIPDGILDAIKILNS